jgi:CheY-like chemotaxis protein
MSKRKHSVCFIDDSVLELRRFRENLKSRFDIGIGRTLDDAMADLQRQGREKPDLFVLDLYFPEGPPNTETELAELGDAWAKYNRAHADFLSVLAKLRQTSAGGQALAEQVGRAYGSDTYVFFTRKGILEEGLRCLRRGALDVIKKPDPSTADTQGRSLIEAEDEAFRNKSPEIAAELLGAIREANWWWKHREAVYAGLIAFFVGILANVLTQVLCGFVRRTF